MRGRKNQAARGAFWCMYDANQTTKSEILVDNRKIPSLLRLAPMEAENEKKRFFQNGWNGWNRISNFGVFSSSC